MEHKTLRLIIDSGHAWLEIDLNEIPQAAQFATGYGYQDLNLIYLEEDVEMTGFLNYWSLIGNTVTLDETNINGEWRGRHMYPHNKAHATA
jgi:hypothetical protein